MASSQKTRAGTESELHPVVESPPGRGTPGGSGSTMFPETPYGIAKRLEFIRGVINRLQPRTVLEIGCGTGNNVIVPLAEWFPASTFLGVDSDAASIAFAQQTHRRANVAFDAPEGLAKHPPFDLIIASEVIEHVDDPPGFLALLRELLAEDGRLILTLPNGYGPFEWGSLTECLFHLTGLTTLLRKLKRALTGGPPP